jgi:hypothetical protein
MPYEEFSFTTKKTSQTFCPGMDAGRRSKSRNYFILNYKFMQAGNKTTLETNNT